MTGSKAKILVSRGASRETLESAAWVATPQGRRQTLEYGALGVRRAVQLPHGTPCGRVWDQLVLLSNLTNGELREIARKGAP